jgi:hypothetical protein
MKQLVFLLLFFSTAAVAETDHGGVTVHYLYNNCKLDLRVVDGQSLSTGDIFKAGFCVGYLRGYADSMNDIRDDVTAEALVRSFVNFINAHPGPMDSRLAGSVLRDAWIIDGIVIIKAAKQAN